MVEIIDIIERFSFDFGRTIDASHVPTATAV